MAERLNDQAITEGLSDHRRWRRSGGEIVCDSQHADFVAAIAFVNAVADLAEQAGHHPDILVHGYNNVRVSASTHSAGGLTQADLDLAAAIDGLADDH